MSKTLIRRAVYSADLPAINELLKMLTYMRPARSPTEAKFVETFVAPLGTEPDEFGNHWLTIGEAPILWSCHTDTVHKEHGFQNVEYGDGYATTPNGSCLGADCAAGVWIMAQMIRRNIPGAYVFHREEEIGGNGSDYIRENLRERLEGIQYAIAFDRAGNTDIITTQIGQRCASDVFARSLSEALNIPLEPTRGTFTDTAHYMSIIPECSNISVGYDNAHSKNEYLDVTYLVSLLSRILKADFSTLIAERVPEADEPVTWQNYDWPDDDRLSPNADIEEIIYDYPDDVAAFLKCQGYSAADLIQFIQSM